MPGFVAGAPAFTLVAVAPLVSFATRSGMHKQGEPTVDTTGHTAHHQVEVVADSASQLRARYGFWTWMDNPITTIGTLLIDASLVLPNNSIVPITFNGGASTLSFTADGSTMSYVDSDVIPGVTLTRGQKPSVRSFARAQSGTAGYGSSWYSDTGTFSWYQTGNHLADDPTSPPTLPGPAYTNTTYLSPIALLGRQA